MVLLSAMRPRDPRYSALPLAEGPDIDATLAYVVLHSPVIDPVAHYAYARAAGRTDIWPKQVGYFITMEAMRESNPRQILDQAEEVEFPPTQIIHGSADMNVPVAEVEDFAQAYRSAFLQRLLKTAAPDTDVAAPYRAAGGVLELEEFLNLPHVFVNPALQPAVAQPDRDRALQLMQRFIARRQAAGLMVVS